MFVLSKLVGFLITPLHTVLILFVLGAVFQGRWLGRFCARVALVVTAVISLTPISEFAVERLETTYPQIDIPPSAEIAGAIILGGAQGDGFAAERYQTYTLNERAERLTTVLTLRRERPDMPILLSGGSGRVLNAGWRERQVNAVFFNAMGVDPATLLHETTSRNTFENAVESAKLLPKDDPRPWLLVTSAFHMPRSVEIFERVGLAVKPFPVDFQIGRVGWSIEGINPSDRFDLARTALKEHVGMLYFRHLQSRKLGPAEPKRREADGG